MIALRLEVSTRRYMESLPQHRLLNKMFEMLATPAVSSPHVDTWSHKLNVSASFTAKLLDDPNFVHRMNHTLLNHTAAGALPAADSNPMRQPVRQGARLSRTAIEITTLKRLYVCRFRVKWVSVRGEPLLHSAPAWASR